uniref:Uncharacterized protein n=1 Tax=Rhizophora mucronata TaxID=61149 RepID=A0A2P2NWZ1_RHIMU
MKSRFTCSVTNSF